MKKNSRRWMMAGMCLMTGLLGVRAQATLSMENFQIRPGETRTVTIDMENSVEIRALQVLVDLPDNVKMVSRPKVAGRQGMSSDNVEAVKTLSYKLHNNGDCMIVVNAGDAVPFSGTEGAVVTLTLKASEDAGEGITEINLKEMELVYADGYTYVRPADYTCQVDVSKTVLSITALAGKVQGPVDVYTPDGALVKAAIPVANLEQELPRGIYVIEGMKVRVR